MSGAAGPIAVLGVVLVVAGIALMAQCTSSFLDSCLEYANRDEGTVLIVVGMVVVLTAIFLSAMGRREETIIKEYRRRPGESDEEFARRVKEED